MRKFLPIIGKSSLFNGIEENEIQKALIHLKYQIMDYEKGTYLFMQGDKIQMVGMVLTGQVHIMREDFWGNRSLVSEIGQGDLFGESYACTDSKVTEVSALCVKQGTKVLFFQTDKLFDVGDSDHKFQNKLIRNLIAILAEKNRILSGKMDHMSRKTTREKLLSYLSSQSLRCNSKEFSIPFDRQQLADYLSVDRSAMSKELSKMRDDGILDYSKNKFVIR